MECGPFSILFDPLTFRMTSTERTPLLADTFEEGEANFTLAELGAEAREMLPLAWPVSIGYLLQMSLGIVRVLTHLNPLSPHKAVN
ncbi:hypothetical protein BC830DRAFT_1088169 [Chytriomyces sp. MP71]|nr:hypothetical protein BC830DRAFT_1088169 [Chytriomyces sp. MP71]